MWNWLVPSRCAACETPGGAVCAACRRSLLAMPMPRPAAGVHAALPFAGTARTLLLALKYRNRREVAAVLARVALHRTLPGTFDLVTWAPTAPERIRRRGFDQSYLLAAAIARELGVPCRRLLFRSHAPAQTGRRRAERLSDTGRYRGRRAVGGLRVLLVDDVVTTGATLRDARAALEAAGIDEVVALAVAATPDDLRRHGPSDTAALRRSLTSAGGPRR